MLEELSYFSLVNVTEPEELHTNIESSFSLQNNKTLFVLEGEKDISYFDTVSKLVSKGTPLNNSNQLTIAVALFDRIYEEGKKRWRIEPYKIITYCNYVNNQSSLYYIFSSKLSRKNDKELMMMLRALKWVPGKNLHKMLRPKLSRIYSKNQAKIKNIIDDVRSYWTWLDTF